MQTAGTVMVGPTQSVCPHTSGASSLASHAIIASSSRSFTGGMQLLYIPLLVPWSVSISSGVPVLLNNSLSYHLFLNGTASKYLLPRHM